MYIVKVKNRYVSLVESEEKGSLTVTLTTDRYYAKEYHDKTEAFALAVDLNGVVEHV